MLQLHFICFERGQRFYTIWWWRCRKWSFQLKRNHGMWCRHRRRNSCQWGRQCTSTGGGNESSVGIRGRQKNVSKYDVRMQHRSSIGRHRNRFPKWASFRWWNRQRAWLSGWWDLKWNEGLWQHVQRKASAACSFQVWTIGMIPVAWC